MKKGQKMSEQNKTHLSKMWRGKRKGRQNPHWKTGKWADKDGYVMVYSPNHPSVTYGCYVREHRLVMEKHIGRYLKKGEIIHHINGIKNDNRIENLIMIGSQSIHISEHNKKKQRDARGRFID